MNYKVDIFKLLGDIASGKMSSIDGLSEDELKTVSPYVLQMWIKGANNYLDSRIHLTNAWVNPYIFSLQNHPKLLFKLLAYANDLNTEVRFSFKKRKPVKSNNFTVQTLMKYYKENESHAADLIPLLSIENIMDIGGQLGYEKDELKKLKNENKTI